MNAGQVIQQAGIPISPRGLPPTPHLVERERSSQSVEYVPEIIPRIHWIVVTILKRNVTQHTAPTLATLWKARMQIKYRLM